MNLCLNYEPQLQVAPVTPRKRDHYTLETTQLQARKDFYKEGYQKLEKRVKEMESILLRKEKTIEEFRREKLQIESTQNTVRTLGESHAEEMNNIKVSLNSNLRRMLLTHR